MNISNEQLNNLVNTAFSMMAELDSLGSVRITEDGSLMGTWYTDDGFVDAIVNPNQYTDMEWSAIKIMAGWDDCSGDLSSFDRSFL